MPEPTPAILAVIDDPARAETVTGALEARYATDYTIVSLVSAHARDELEALARRGVPVALVLVEHQSDAGALLGSVRALHQHAKRALLLRWGENRAAREAIVGVLSAGQADYFIVEPQSSPDEQFHRAVTEF